MTQKASYARALSLLSGETVTGGKFRCRECDYRLEKPAGKVTNLPVCPRCQCESWERD